MLLINKSLIIIVQKMEPIHITKQRNIYKSRNNYIQDWDAECKNCRKMYSQGVEIMTSARNNDSYKIKLCWNYYIETDKSQLCFECLEKMSIDELKIFSNKLVQEEKCAEFNTVWDLCLICKEKLFERNIHENVKIDVCNSCRAAVMSIKEQQYC